MNVYYIGEFVAKSNLFRRRRACCGSRRWCSLVVASLQHNRDFDSRASKIGSLSNQSRYFFHSQPILPFLFYCIVLDPYSIRLENFKLNWQNSKQMRLIVIQRCVAKSALRSMSDAQLLWPCSIIKQTTDHVKKMIMNVSLIFEFDESIRFDFKFLMFMFLHLYI